MLYKNAPRLEYRLKDGTLVPGVTTVIDVLAKPALHKWYWEGGKGSSPEMTFLEWQVRSRDSTAGVGTIVHYKIKCFLKGEKEEYGPGWEEEHIKMAQVPFEVFLLWHEKSDVKPILIEHSIVHERDRYGGTFDLLAETNHGLELIDFKTSKRIFDEYYIQLAAYRKGLPEYSGIKERIILITKDGKLNAPYTRRLYMQKARKTWDNLIKMYHKLNEFRKAA